MAKAATAKQIKAAKLMVENGGIASRAMIEAGYSPATAKTPQKLTNSPVVQELLEDIADETLVKKSKRNLNKILDLEEHPNHYNASISVYGINAKIKGDQQNNKELINAMTKMQDKYKL